MMDWRIKKIKNHSYEGMAITGDGHTMFLNDVFKHLKRKEYLEKRLKWKTPEVDGIPEKGVYLCKIDSHNSFWCYHTAEIIEGEFRTYHGALLIKPNFYRLIEEG